MKETNALTAFLDANVLYPALLRNIHLRLASHGLFQPKWSNQVHDEWMSALRRDRPDLTFARIESTRHLMDAHFPDACVDGYEHLIAMIKLPDANDRHIVAAAIQGGAHLIVTTNLRDFPETTLTLFNLEAMHPDEFILGLLRESESEVINALRQLRFSLKNPPQTAIELLAIMKRYGLIASVDALGFAVDRL